MKNISILEEFAPSKVNPFIETFKVFNEVIKSCYRTNLISNYKELIKNFRVCYRRLPINVTPEVHAVFFHVEDFCEVVEMGLGPWREHATESLHADFNKVWTR